MLRCFLLFRNEYPITSIPFDETIGFSDVILFFISEIILTNSFGQSRKCTRFLDGVLQLKCEGDDETMAKIQPKIVLNAMEQEKVLQTLQEEDSKKSGNKIRVTIDFTQAVHDQIKTEMDYTGQTIKGFVTTLVREYFEKNQR